MEKHTVEKQEYNFCLLYFLYFTMNFLQPWKTEKYSSMVENSFFCVVHSFYFTFSYKVVINNFIYGSQQIKKNCIIILQMRFYSIALTSNFENTPLLHNALYDMKLHSITKYIVEFKGLKSWKKKSFRFIGSKHNLIAIENLIIFYHYFYRTPETKSLYISKSLIWLKKKLWI